jgi:integrase
MWKKLRERAFGKKEAAASKLAKRPYDLRHAAVSTWLASGVEAPRVAAWAGHGVDVLLRVYAKLLDGEEDVARKRIEAACVPDSAAPGPAKLPVAERGPSR